MGRFVLNRASLATVSARIVSIRLVYFQSTVFLYVREAFYFLMIYVRE